MIKMNLRSSIYETNSSSSHTLVITNKKSYVEPNLIERELSDRSMLKYNDNEFYIVPSGTCFGSDFGIIDDWYSKFEYLLGSFKYDITILEHISEAISEYIPNCKGILIDGDSVFNDNSEVYDVDWLSDALPIVDHQSQDIMPVLINYMKEHNYTIINALKEIIFSNKFIIITDSDSSNVICDLVEAGLFDREKFEKILYISYVNYSEPAKAYFFSLEEYKKFLFKGDEDN